jgi:hypothetical protein
MKNQRGDRILRFWKICSLALTGYVKKIPMLNCLSINIFFLPLLCPVFSQYCLKVKICEKGRPSTPLIEHIYDNILNLKYSSYYLKLKIIFDFGMIKIFLILFSIENILDIFLDSKNSGYYPESKLFFWKPNNKNIFD